jgi:D-proline reductase (dithiol) PrdB
MPAETFKQYVESLSYGSRTDLLFKFLKYTPEADAEVFVQSLLRELGNAMDTGDVSALSELVYREQLATYSPPDEEHRWKYDDAPFAPMKKPLSEMRVGLLTSSGHHIAGTDNTTENLARYTQEEATKHIGEFGRARPMLSAIPIDRPAEKLAVLQPGYDTRAAVKDRNTVMPIDRMKEMASEGVIGEFAETAYSFIGVTSQLRLSRENAPEWATKVRDEGWEAAVLVPV